MILFVLPGQKLHAQSSEETAIERLKAEGFEEIRIRKEGTQIICTVERGLTRTPSEDFRKAFIRLNESYPDTCKFRIILLEQGQPVYQLSADGGKNDLQDSTAVNNRPYNGKITWYDKDTYKQIKKETVSRPVRRGVTIVLYPQFTLRNMLLSQIYEVQLNIAPTLHYSGWKGMLLTGQLILPIVNELSYTDHFIRPGFLTFSQNFLLPSLNSLKFTAGNFNANRYGFDLRWKKRFQNSRWNLGAVVGMTGRSYFYNNYWNHNSPNYLSWSVKAGYYIPYYQLRADVQAGRFLAHEKGARVDLYRHFGETTIGAYVVHAGGTTNGGFHFAFPLDPFKRKHKHRIRVMLPSAFDMEYNAANDFVYGRYYETSPDENRSVQDLYPQSINELFINH
ncbi:MAG TPA: hypothetical protein VFG54_08580 [Prolixibacteraceae bacterium]|nr:hypothetical protein [Prolixibacteraceae bacterium]